MRQPGGARRTCAADTEPNDTPETAAVVDGPGCIAGTLPDSDQDLFLWTVTDAEASQPWDLDHGRCRWHGHGRQGAPGLHPHPARRPWSSATRSWRWTRPWMPSGRRRPPDVLLPAGRYLVGITRSATADGGPPVDISYRATIAAGAPLPPTRGRRAQRRPDHRDPAQRQRSTSAVTCATRWTTTAGPRPSSRRARRGTCAWTVS